MSQFDDTQPDGPNKKFDLNKKIEHTTRKSGGLKGQIWVSDNFDEPMSEEELALWYDAPIFPADE